MTNKFINVTVSTTLSKSIYIEVPEGATKEEIEQIAKDTVHTPQQILQKIASILQQFNVSITGLELEDWNVDELTYLIENNETDS